ncbi:MAG: cellulase family glycosylhydrolase [Clostridiales bacterium]|jgi:endoglucanase|nr:cellulase family glycosylhydrolase [Clostridiales bacterium]
MTKLVMPRYRGFNLLDLFSTSNRWDEHFPMTHGEFLEDDFRFLNEWGFNFVRVPMSYLYFVADSSRRKILESKLETLDRLVRLGEKYGVHISLSFHRAPGYCVTAYPFDVKEIGNLWKNKDDLELFCFYWEAFARRYQGVSNNKLSFDLVNEPPNLADGALKELTPLLSDVTTAEYIHVHRTATERIHAIDPDRMVIIEGSNGTMTPSEELKDLPNAVQSMHHYFPMYVTHHKCPWISEIDDSKWPYPYEGIMNGQVDVWDKKHIRDLSDAWFRFAREGYSVHLGECGCYKYTPHEVVLRWFEDLLDIVKENNIGFSLWNFKGPFGILDSERKDVDYEDWYGHKLDRKLLNLLQKY